LNANALERPARPGDEQHSANPSYSYPGGVFDVLLPVVQVLLSAFLIMLVLMHSGRDTGFGGMGYTPASQGGQHIVERNLTRLTVVVGVLFGLNTIALFYVL
jgi:preprotein translocase subunit SecG